MSGIIALSHLPSSELQTGFEFNDKAAHMILYSGLGFFMMRFFRIVLEYKLSKAALMTMISGTVFGITDEIHQGFVGYFETGVFGGARNPEIADIAADASGLLMTCVVFIFLYRYIIRQNKTKTQE